MNEHDTLKRLKKGDRSAFNAMFSMYAAKLYHFSLNYLHSETDAQEIVQETFLKVWETRHSIDENQNFGSYIFSIAKHRIYNLFRRRTVEKRYLGNLLPETEAAVYPVLPETGAEMERKIHIGIERLPRQQREILKMKTAGMDNGQIADSLSISRRTVETHIRRSYKSLREYLASGAETVVIVIATGITALI